MKAAVEIDSFNHPQPDIVLLRPRDDFYTTTHPTPRDIFLLIEIALSSLVADRRVKIPLYARADICECWQVNLVDRMVETYREPSESGYRNIMHVIGEDTISPEALPDVRLHVDKIIHSMGRKD